ncbi:hypothetical protein ZHAS_00020678 [Anopheles sinensis]|uniref:Uncharacterized protein n=1 Tax=Anopheles sinensis TaxID=74873 RepID=A0A084WQE8_ANOSI|nr:hypothetical protein ZHAS_00020678 [Anopheles sinensis]
MDCYDHSVSATPTTVGGSTVYGDFGGCGSLLYSPSTAQTVTQQSLPDKSTGVGGGGNYWYFPSAHSQPNLAVADSNPSENCTTASNRTVADGAGPVVYGSGSPEISEVSRDYGQTATQFGSHNRSVMNSSNRPSITYNGSNVELGFGSLSIQGDLASGNGSSNNVGVLEKKSDNHGVKDRFLVTNLLQLNSKRSPCPRNPRLPSDSSELNSSAGTGGKS